MSTQSYQARPTPVVINEPPQTMEGHCVLHDAYQVRWEAWRALPDADRAAIIAEAVAWLGAAPANLTALFSEIGQKSELVFLHYRPTFIELNKIERSFRRLRLGAYLQPAWSYLSVIEASLYEAAAMARRAVAERGVKPDAPEFREALEAEMATQRAALEARVRRDIPAGRYLCFYPMNKRRGEHINWYALPLDERRALMRDHGRIGHKYHGIVTQVVGGSIGIDDWEWGITLHGNDVIQFKKLITEMRFDPSSALYAEFGPFHLGVRQQPEDLADLLAGSTAPA